MVAMGQSREKLENTDDSSIFQRLLSSNSQPQTPTG
jgi:hypothetical protein